jgi:hypothetical protein
MSVAELEQVLDEWRSGRRSDAVTSAPRLSIGQAIEYRNSGNLPDDHGRTLRLLLLVDDVHPGAVEAKRLRYEPDHHDQPRWRRIGSVPVNVVPLRVSHARRPTPRPWFEEPSLAALEREWQASGTVDGVRVPAEYRGFVYKTALALRGAGRDVTVEALAASISRWVSPQDARRIRSALLEVNGG